MRMRFAMPDTIAPRSMLYETDFYAWANEQAALLRAGRFEDADIAGIAEEIESMGRSEKRELISRLTVLLVHLLKWRFQPARRSASWRLSIEGQRIDIVDHLDDNPSLKSKLDDALVRAYRRAVIEAARETGMDKSAFPASSPWNYDEIIDDDFWPEG